MTLKQLSTAISIVLRLLPFLILSQVHVVQTPQGEDYEGRSFHGKRVSELHLLPVSPPVFLFSILLSEQFRRVLSLPKLLHLTPVSFSLLLLFDPP